MITLKKHNVHDLDGDYKIELFPGGDYYFYGWIVL
jgi:hypothetical protein